MRACRAERACGAERACRACVPKLEQRAERLFSVRNASADEVPKKLRAKNFPGPLLQ